MNENYEHPAIPAGAEEGILKGLYLWRESKSKSKSARSSWARGRSCAKSSPRETCSKRTGKSRPISGARPASPSFAAKGSLPSAGTCCTGGQAAHAVRDRASGRARRPGGGRDRLHENVRRPDQAVHAQGPRLSRAGDRRLRPLGFALKLRHFFEVDRYFIAIAALKALGRCRRSEAQGRGRAIKKYGINPEKYDR